MEKSNKEYPISQSQLGIIVSPLATLDRKRAAYFNTLTCAFEWNEPDQAAIVASANMLLKVNDALRMRMIYRFPFTFRQYFTDYEPETLDELTFDTDEAYERWLEEAKCWPVPMFAGKLYRFKLLHRPGGKATLWLQFNHLTIDGYSVKLIAQQIIRYYEAFHAGRTPEAGPVGSYVRYLEKEREYRNSKQHAEDGAYWRAAFKAQPRFSFPAGRRKMNLEATSEWLVIEGELYDRLNEFCRGQGCSQSSVLMTLAALTTYALTGKDNFSIASLSYGRMDAVARRTIGCMVSNPVVMYLVNPQLSFAEYALESYRNGLEMMRHLRYEGSRMTVYSYPKCVKAGFNFNYAWLLFSPMDFESVFRETGIRGRMFWSNSMIPQLYCAVFDIPKENRVEIELRYQVKGFSAKQIRRILDTAINILTRALEDPEKPMGAYLGGFKTS